jgi:hypothetical protein
MYYSRYYRSLCRCGCWHPHNDLAKNIVDGCICHYGTNKKECKQYIPSDNLEYLEYQYDKKHS